MSSPSPLRTGGILPPADAAARPAWLGPKAWAASGATLLIAGTALAFSAGTPAGHNAGAALCGAGAACALGLVQARKARRLTERLIAAERHEALRAALVSHSSLAVIVCDAQDRVVEINAAADALLGFTANELRGRGIRTVFSENEIREELARLRAENGSPVDETQLARSLLEANATRAADREWTLQRKDGTSLPAFVCLAPLLDPRGRFDGSVRVVRDMSAETRARESAALERRRFEELFEHAPAAVAILDRNLRYLAISRRWISDFHLEGMTLIGRDHLDIFSTLPRHWREIYRRCLDGASEQGEDDRMLLPDGTEEFIRWECRPWRDAQGAIGGVAIFSEILTAKRLEQKLCDSQALLSSAQALAHLGSWELDAETGKLTWSAEMKRIHSLDTSVTISFEQAMAFPLPEHRSRLMDAFEYARLTGEGWDLELQVMTNDRRAIWIRSIGQVERRDGEAVRYLGTAQDITERKRTEQELTAAKDRALRVAQEKSEFLANMSHEIRTPLNAVIGMTGLLMNTALDSEQREFVSTVRTASDNLLELINDILDFSKVESGKLELEHQPFSLQSCIESALDLVAPRAAEKKLELACWIDRTVPAILVGDVTRLRQIVVNLLANAVKFTATGEVFVSISAHRGETPTLRASVRDTGIGIPADRMTRLFQSFSQVDSSTARTHGGTGLGLAISRRLVELMGGKIWAESQVGRGSIFHFEIPLCAGEETESVRRKDPLADHRFLVVEDNASAREIVQLHLEEWGARVVPVASAMAALALVRQGEKFDALIVDRTLPSMDGLQLARQLRGLPEGLELPIVLLSGLGQPAISPEEGSFSGVLNKPLKPHQLLRVLTRIVAADRETDTIVAAAAPVLPAWARDARVLVVEDNAANQRVAVALLQRLGISPEVAADGIDAIRLLDAREFDLVLMDLQMPNLDGQETTREIRRRWPAGRQPKILAMTAGAGPRDHELWLTAGADDLITKPVRLEQLHAKLGHWLGERKRSAAKLA